MRKSATLSLSCVLFVCLATLGVQNAEAQIKVNGANPNNTAQGTTNLNVIVSGSGFKKGAQAQWFATGTTNPGGVTVNSTTFNSSGQLTANITVAVDAVIGNFDVQVKNTDGRTGKGTELFAVKSKQAASCPTPVPLNPTPATFACSNATGQTCLDSTFGNAILLPPGGLVLTNTDGAVSPTQDVDGAQSIKQQQQPDGTLMLVAIGITTNPNVSGQSGVAVARYNLDGSLDTTFGSGGIAKFFSASSNFMLVHDGAVDASGNILAVADQNGATGVVRFTPTGVLDPTFNSTGYVTLSNVKPLAMRVQSDGKIVIGGTRISGKTIVGVVVRLNTNGSLDTGFGSNGQATINSLYLLYALALQSVNSQQYILAGGEGAGSNNFSVVRLTPSGSLDSSFGVSGGVAATNFCGLPSTVFSLSVDSIGSILAGGTAQLVSTGPPAFGIARFTSNGVLDTGFGDFSTSSSGRTGQTMLDFFGSENHATSIQPVLDSGGNEIAFMVGGYVFQSTGSNTFKKYLAIAEYHADGSLDTTFGTNGGVAVDFGSANNSVLSPANDNLLIQTDGKIVIGGTAGFTSGSFSGYNFALARFWP